ncbi:M1 family metallopeptidase [Nocardioides sp. URHA0032]|uniref:M1 family metallopeptidase n=1 Tax=Nocardioides sp. URHA0032 TaxID=1380388 RepID=UPI0006883A76|nr:M1 family metallopeptidase [Nocardioides sp. URHA0032]
MAAISSLKGMVCAAVTAAVVVGGAAGPLAAAPGPGPVPGSTGSGDSLFPQAGNGGYDAQRYRVVLDYRRDGSISASTRLTARARHPLSSFSLDLEGLRVERVRVDGREATFRRHGHELVITPVRPVRGAFAARVAYHGTPHSHTDPDGSSEGWIATADGATTVNEPVGAMTWFPDNDTPRDKARYTFAVTAPSRRAVVANGILVDRSRHGARTTWTWRQGEPMASYLAMISIGDYRVFRSTMRTVAGRRLPVWSFVERSLGPQRGARHLVPRIVRWEERRFGAYPFDSTGMVAHELSVGYALETQDRPVYPGGPGVGVLVHELAHQWYGDSVTPRDWGDIWLNEGFATYAEWLWTAAHGGDSTRATFRALYRQNGPKSDLWKPAPAALSDPADLFGPAYLRGAMTLQVLRQRVGTDHFFDILRSWARLRRHGGASTHGFIGLSERISGDRLHRMFRRWLYTPARPRGY